MKIKRQREKRKTPLAYCDTNELRPLIMACYVSDEEIDPIKYAITIYKYGFNKGVQSVKK